MTTKVLPLILAAAIGLTSSIAFSGSAHAGNPNQPPCTAGPLCKDDPHNPGGDNPDPGAGVIPIDAMIIGCRVWADPKPTPDDLKFRNIGGKTIPAGTRV